MRCLGIDFGSTTIKGGVLDLESGQISDIVRVPFPAAIDGLPLGYHEVSPTDVLIATRQVIEQMVQRAPDARHLLPASQMGGLLLTNAQNQPLTNYISWRDQRTLSKCSDGRTYTQALRESWSNLQFSQLGCELKPGSATSLLYWLNHNGCLPEGAQVVSIGDYVLGQLCHVEPCWDRTLAIGLLNLSTNQWHDSAFESAGFNNCVFPKLIEPGIPIGSLQTGSRTLSCFAALGDQQAALRGADLQLGELSINCSTGSQVSEIKRDFKSGDFQTRCWFGGSFLNTITHIPAGRSLAVLESLLMELPRAAGLEINNSWAIIAQAAERASNRNTTVAGGLRCDLSFFDSALGFNGCLTGITTENLDAGNLFEAAFEYMAEAYWRCSQQLDATMPWNRVVVSGGLVQSFPTLQQRLFQRFPIPYREIVEQEETLLGLLAIARQSPSGSV